jgi:O-antigen/teichoic acid export membrane protein
MRGLRSNIIANLVGQGWSTVVALACIPVFIRQLGIEGYGLIGFYMTMRAAMQVLDLGLSPTVNRELARASAVPTKWRETLDFVRTSEIGYWVVGVLLGASVTLAAPHIAVHWISANALPIPTVERAVGLMGLVAALQWPLSFYQGGLMGLQQQVLLNSIRIATSTAANIGAVGVLLFVSSSLSAFFKWQAVVSALHVALVAVFLWKGLSGRGYRPRVRLDAVRGVWRFAAGMSGIAVSALVLMQVDKILLSNLLDLDAFGYYMVAVTIGSGFSALIAGPIFNALFPRLSELAAADSAELSTTYHRASQALAALVLPAAAVLSLFSSEIVLAWTGDPTTARNTAASVSLLVAGSALNALMTLPYALQLAHGWTSIGLRINLLLILISVPATILLARTYGAVGAAAVWLLVNAVYMAVGVPMTHRRLLPKEGWRWLRDDVTPPLLAAAVVVGASRKAIDRFESGVQLVATLALIATLALAVSILSAPALRGWVISQFRRSRTRPGERMRARSQPTGVKEP